MRFLDYLKLAYKNFSRRKTRTALTITAITVGSFTVILMVALLLGVRQSMIEAFEKMGAMDLITVTQDPNSTENNQFITNGNGQSDDNLKKLTDTTLSDIIALPNVVDATPIGSGIWMKTTRLEGQAKKIWPNLISFDPETSVFDMPLLAGRKLRSYDMDSIVVGAGFADTYGYTANPKELIGKKVIFDYETGGGSHPDWGDLPPKPPMNADKSWYESQSKTVPISAEIVGVADNGAIDRNQNYISITWGKKLMTSVRWEWGGEAQKQCEESKKTGAQVDCSSFGGQSIVKEDNFTKQGYGSIILKVNNTENITSVAESISKMGYGVTTAQNMIDQMNRIFLVVGLGLGLVGGISLFVAAIGIINTMVMATYERTREIGVMRACGATRAVIRRLFTFEAALLGFCGGVLGLIISIILSQVAKLIATKYAAQLGGLPLDNIGSFPWWLILGVIAFTTIIGLLSGLGPAVRAAKLNPVDALRYE